MAQRRLQPLRSEGKTSWHHCTSNASGHGQPAPGGEWHSQKPPNQERGPEKSKSLHTACTGPCSSQNLQGTFQGASAVHATTASCPRTEQGGTGPAVLVTTRLLIPPSPGARADHTTCIVTPGTGTTRRVQAGTKPGVQVLGVVHDRAHASEPQKK